MQLHTVQIPDKCSECNGETFNIWGTTYPNKTKITVKCMRCGKPSIENLQGIKAT